MKSRLIGRILSTTFLTKNATQRCLPKRKSTQKKTYTLSLSHTHTHINEHTYLCLGFNPCPLHLSLSHSNSNNHYFLTSSCLHLLFYAHSLSPSVSISFP